ncbi:MAG TPA: hypothetical protein VIK69_10450 [Methylophilaceae bacterium]|jgi:hypothetical protein
MRRTPAPVTSPDSLRPKHQLLDIFEVFAHLPADGPTDEERQTLLRQLSSLARQTKLDDPQGIALQLLHMAATAKKRQLTDPESNALHHARIAATALIESRRQNRFRRNSVAYAMAASLFLLVGIGGPLLFAQPEPSSALLLQADAGALDQTPQPTGPDRLPPPSYNPKRMSDMIAKREMMRQGTCIFPEALMLAEAERGIYLQQVVKGNISTDYREQEIADRLMQTVRCDYSPMLMRNSVS